MLGYVARAGVRLDDWPLSGLWLMKEVQQAAPQLGYLLPDGEKVPEMQMAAIISFAVARPRCRHPGFMRGNPPGSSSGRKTFQTGIFFIDATIGACSGREHAPDPGGVEYLSQPRIARTTSGGIDEWLSSSTMSPGQICAIKIHHQSGRVEAQHG